MFENTIKTNGTQSWKWITITGRVFVDNVALEAMSENNPDKTQTECFEELARERISDLIQTDEPFKLAEISFA